jgi:DNA-binding LacI/PurR family transcriptional regulator
MGSAAARSLLALISGGAIEPLRVLPYRLIVRASAAPRR